MGGLTTAHSVRRSGYGIFECVRVAVNVICPGQPQLRDNDINANPGNNISYTHSLHVQRPLRRTLFVEYAFNEVIDLRRGEAFVRLIYLLKPASSSFFKEWQATA